MRSQRPVQLGLILLAALLAAAPAWCGPRDHRDGFFLRLAGGFGLASSSIDDVPGSVDRIEVSGPCGDLDIAIGGVVRRNLALHGSLWGFAITDDEVDTTGALLPGGSDFNMSAVGFGITYWFMPINMYLSPALGIGSVTLQRPGSDFQSDPGIAFMVTLGKEWWVSRGWGLGLAGGLGLHSIEGEGTTEDWRGSNLAVRFSATFN
jgi:hypothetical protein